MAKRKKIPATLTDLLRERIRRWTEENGCSLYELTERSNSESLDRPKCRRTASIKPPFFCFSNGLQEESAVNALFSKVRRLLVNEDGPTAVEYAVLLALIVAVCVPIVKTMCSTPSGMFRLAVSAFGS